jgi:hypothetical protein
MLFYNLLQDVLSYVSIIAKLNLFVLFQAYVVSNGLPLSENIIQHGAPISRHLAPFGSGNAIVQERKKRRRLKKFHSKFSRRAGCKVMKTAT